MPHAPDHAPAPTPAPALPDGLRLGRVVLATADLARAVAWYERVLGLRVHARAADRAELGDGGTVVLVLEHEPGARPAPRRHAGLYHYALRYPTRAALARAAARLVAAEARLQGAADHGTHEAIYLADRDGHGIELAADRPRAAWPPDLGYAGGPAPLDLPALLATIAGAPSPRAGAGVDPGLPVGHLHLHVGDLGRALAFYRDVLGFAERAHLGSAAFVAAGGYHHHLGLNVWRGEGVPPAPRDAVGLRRWTVRLPTDADVAAVRGRLERASLTHEAVPGGVLARDPWAHAVALLADR